MTSSVTVKAIGPCEVERYQKKFGDLLVVVERQGFDDWAEVILTVPDGVQLPESGISFSLSDLAIEHNILDISEDCDIQYSILTDFDDDDIQEIVDQEIEEDDLEGSWDHIGSDYIIDMYEIIDN